MNKKNIDVKEQIRVEHACIKNSIEIILNEIRTIPKAQDFVKWKMEFIWRLKDFGKHLKRHFELEETHGFVEELIEASPENFNIIKKLESEHDQIIQTLDFICSELNKIKSHDQKNLLPISSWVKDLVSKITTHETAENDLMQKAYYQEYGEVD